MKRDMDLVRELLLYSEVECTGSNVPDIDFDRFDKYSKSDVYAHVILLERDEFTSGGGTTSSSTYIGELTWKGHDLLDSIRDPEIWRQTKAAGEKVGGWTVGLLAEYAKGLIKLQFDSILAGATS